jgi:hypothetical protein
MPYYIGTQVPDPQGNVRYFYAIRRDDQGLLFFAKVDQLKDDDTITINQPGLTENDFTDFEYGVDFFDGRLELDHSRPYSNLQWDQYRWDERNMFYYINENGEFIVRINKAYPYPAELIVS